MEIVILGPFGGGGGGPDDEPGSSMTSAWGKCPAPTNGLPLSVLIRSGGSSGGPWDPDCVPAVSSLLTFGASGGGRSVCVKVELWAMSALNSFMF